MLTEDSVSQLSHRVSPVLPKINSTELTNTRSSEPLSKTVGETKRGPFSQPTAPSDETSCSGRAKTSRTRSSLPASASQQDECAKTSRTRSSLPASASQQDECAKTSRTRSSLPPSAKSRRKLIPLAPPLPKDASLARPTNITKRSGSHFQTRCPETTSLPLQQTDDLSGIAGEAPSKAVPTKRSLKSAKSAELTFQLENLDSQQRCLQSRRNGIGNLRQLVRKNDELDTDATEELAEEWVIPETPKMYKLKRSVSFEESMMRERQLVTANLRRSALVLAGQTLKFRLGTPKRGLGRFRRVAGAMTLAVRQKCLLKRIVNVFWSLLADAQIRHNTLLPMYTVAQSYLLTKDLNVISEHLTELATSAGHALSKLIVLESEHLGLDFSAQKLGLLEMSHLVEVQIAAPTMVPSFLKMLKGISSPTVKSRLYTIWQNQTGSKLLKKMEELKKILLLLRIVPSHQEHKVENGKLLLQSLCPDLIRTVQKGLADAALSAEPVDILKDISALGATINEADEICWAAREELWTSCVNDVIAMFSKALHQPLDELHQLMADVRQRIESDAHSRSRRGSSFSSSHRASFSSIRRASISSSNRTSFSRSSRASFSSIRRASISSNHRASFSGRHRLSLSVTPLEEQNISNDVQRICPDAPAVRALVTSGSSVMASQDFEAQEEGYQIADHDLHESDDNVGDASCPLVEDSAGECELPKLEVLDKSSSRHCLVDAENKFTEQDEVQTIVYTETKSCDSQQSSLEIAETPGLHRCNSSESDTHSEIEGALTSFFDMSEPANTSDHDIMTGTDWMQRTCDVVHGAEKSEALAASVPDCLPRRVSQVTKSVAAMHHHLRRHSIGNQPPLFMQAEQPRQETLAKFDTSRASQSTDIEELEADLDRSKDDSSKTLSLYAEDEKSWDSLTDTGALLARVKASHSQRQQGYGRKAAWIRSLVNLPSLTNVNRGGADSMKGQGLMREVQVPRPVVLIASRNVLLPAARPRTYNATIRCDSMLLPVLTSG